LNWYGAGGRERDVQDSAFDTYGSPTARRYAASVGEAVDAKSDG